MRDIVLYAMDSMADWEFAYLTTGIAAAESQTPGRYRVLLAADGDAPYVTTMGGLRVQTDADLGEVERAFARDPRQIAMLVLPGGNTWASGHDGAISLAVMLLSAGVPVAAICGATTGLARAGILNAFEHTSNSPDFLADVPGYAGFGLYRDARVWVSGDLITAPGTAPVDFARAVFERLELFPPQILDAWHGLYSTGRREYYQGLASM